MKRLFLLFFAVALFAGTLWAQATPAQPAPKPVPPSAEERRETPGMERREERREHRRHRRHVRRHHRRHGAA